MIENLVSVEASIECLTASLFLLPFFVVEAFGKKTWYQVSANQHEEILCYSVIMAVMDRYIPRASLLLQSRFL